VKYLHPEPFSTPATTDAYRDGWERTFAKPENRLPEEKCPCESGKPFKECHGRE